MPIRPANSVNILNRRLSQAEMGQGDAMELIGIHDELSRLERKWMMQLAERSERRKPGDVDKLNRWFQRLQLLIERSLRQTNLESVERQSLERTLSAIRSRPASPPLEQTS